MSHENDYPPQSPWATGMASRCPRCASGKLYRGFITVAPRCDSCGLDLKFADSGDGPAIFIILLAGFFIIGLLLYVEVKYEPPIWLHLLIFLPLTLVVCLGMLRPLKGVLIALQYRNKAEPGRLEN